VVASNPRSSRRCAGICSRIVEIQMAITRASPAQAAAGAHPGGRLPTSQSAVTSSRIIGTVTTQVVRRMCSLSYGTKRSAPTRPMSG
jgi:hypothetical protein